MACPDRQAYSVVRGRGGHRLTASTVRAALVTVEVLAASVWIGGLAAIGIVAQIVRQQLEPAARVDFFRSLGRRYLNVGGGALLMAFASGALLLARGAWTEEKSAAVAVAAALLLATAAGVLQARSLTVMRRRALDGTAQPALTASIRRGARTATLLRASIGALTIALVVIAATIT